MSNTVEDLFSENQNLVYKVISDIIPLPKQEKRMNKGGLSIEDLQQEGLMALWEAANKYNPSLDVKFSSYAYSYIRGKALNLINKTYALKYTDSVPLNERWETEKNLLSFDFKVNLGEDDVPLQDVIEVKDNTDREMSMDILNVISKLDEREQYIIKEVFYKGRSLKDISNELNITHQMVSIIKRRSIKKLKEYLKEYHFNY